MKKPLLIITCLLFVALTKIDAQNRPSNVNKTQPVVGRVQFPQNVTPHPKRAAGLPFAVPITGYFREDFEGSFPPSGWQVLDVAGPTYTWDQYNPFTNE